MVNTRAVESDFKKSDRKSDAQGAFIHFELYQVLKQIAIKYPIPFLERLNTKRLWTYLFPRKYKQQPLWKLKSAYRRNSLEI